MKVDEIRDKVEELIESCEQCDEFHQGMCEDVRDITCWTDCDNRNMLEEIQKKCPHPGEFKTSNTSDDGKEVVSVCELCHQHIGYRHLANGTKEVFNPNECEVNYKNHLS